MTDTDWLARLDPAPPVELATAMRNALNEATTPNAEGLLAAAEHALDRVLRTDCETRASALDLLTVDALMTHALEIASRDPNSADDFPEQALRRITSAWQ
ncbi:MAG: hypothetical protein JWM41_1705 [Gemmatimonadetes bacterium]|nr:hypothetical protein [Gemmatimonadota bacterium]